jgi:general secretion pathway protein A
MPFFNLRESPFNLTPDPRFLYLSSQHEEALSHLLYGIHERKGFIEITGEVGTGKTVLCRALLEQLDDSISTALIFNSYLTRTELLEAICRDFGQPMEDDTGAALIDRLNAHLLSAFGAGRNAVVVIDEAQNLEPTVLEQLRMLSNLETAGGKLLQIVLVGQPELRGKLSLPGMRQLDQRIAVRFDLGALSRPELAKYVLHRLQVAGAGDGITFTPRALRMIYRYSGGLPRRINLLCDRALMTAFVHETRRIDGAIVRRSARDLDGGRQIVGTRRPETRLVGRLALASLAGCALLGLVTSAWMLPGVRTGFTSQAAKAVPTRLETPASPPVTRVPDSGLPAAPGTRTPGSPSKAAPAPSPERTTPLAHAELLQALWRLKSQAEASLPTSQDPFSADWGDLLRTVAGTLDVMAFQPRLAQLLHISRPCFIEVLPHASAKHAALWVLARGLPDGVLIYRGSGELTPVPLSELRRVWYGALYLTTGVALHAWPTLQPGMQGRQVRALQQALKQGGYFSGVSSGLFDHQTRQAVKRFQRDNWLPVDGNAGRQTLVTLLHFGGDALEDTT